MTPSEAAIVLEGIDDAIAYDALLQMDSKKAGKVLDAMTKERAIKLSTRLLRRRS